MTPVPLLHPQRTLSNGAPAGIRLTRPLCGFNLEQGNLYAAPTRKGRP